MNQTNKKTTLEADFAGQQSAAFKYQRENPQVALRFLLLSYPARGRNPLPPAFYDFSLEQFTLRPVTLPPDQGYDLTPEPPPDTAGLNQTRAALDDLFQQMSAAPTASTAAPPPLRLPDNAFSEPTRYPDTLTDREATLTTYQHELEEVIRFLRNDLSVLIQCDKILTEHIYEYVCHGAGRQWILEDGSRAARPGGQPASPRQDFKQAVQGGGPPPDPAQALTGIIRTLQANELLVLRSLELLDSPPLIETLYQGVSGQRKPQLLAFVDPTLEVKQVLLNRFAIRLSIMGLPRHIQPDKDKEPIPTVTRLMTQTERQVFGEFDAEAIYKNVSGLNPVQFRDAMRYVAAVLEPGSPARDIYDRIRYFKTSTSNEIEIPRTKFEEIGGYEQVKQELKRIIDLVAGRVAGISREQRDDLVPRGLIFHGPPGTGKTLFAKAIANAMNATIQMVSGPEVMDKYVGQSESNLRQIFATARRNAPSVILFDEFDSLASQRSTYTDGGARANNAVVAQLLTELDGFRRDEMVLVIGTTNRLDIIDEALLRPSRLKPIQIDRPDTIARRDVARIHAEKFGVAQIVCDLGDLFLRHLPDWEAAGEANIPPAFLAALFAYHVPYGRRYETEAQRERFNLELRQLYRLVTATQATRATPTGEPEPMLGRLEERLLQMAPAYGLDLTPAAGERQLTPANSVQADIADLFRFIQQQRPESGAANQGEAEAFWHSIIDLVAEYTEGFNNDEIRAIFQEASLEHHLEGQLITPRYLGMKIGIIRRRRDERSTVHLDRERGRR